jgi:hypothetical protein
MGGLLWLAAPLLLGVSGHDLAQAVAVAMLISGGAAIYGLLLALLGVVSWDEAVNAIRLPADSGLRD